MFYSTKEFIAAAPTCLSLSPALRAAPPKVLATMLRRVKQGIMDREGGINAVIDGVNYGHEHERTMWIGKFARPWQVVPRLTNLTVPEGDFSVGVEVEMGFRTLSAVQNVINKIKNWKYVAVDAEGGRHGAEVTFAPVLYSKFDGRCQAIRYLKLLGSPNILPSVFVHDPNHHVGTHINVGAPSGTVDYRRLGLTNSCLMALSHEDKHKYFGRAYPYRYGFNHVRFIEWKLFNSVTDWKILRRYVDVAVAITALIAGTEAINAVSVRAALEAGYNKNEGN